MRGNLSPSALRETPIKYLALQELTNIDLFMISKDVEESLVRHDTAKCLAWCHDNKSKLKKMRVSPSLFLIAISV